MFTGLVESMGTISAVEPDGEGSHIEVSTELAGQLREGDSVAVNGVCLTAVTARGDSFRADVMAETLRRSSLGPLQAGDNVNLELPARAGAPLGGHIVQGHVDATGTVEQVRDDGFARTVRVACPDTVLRYVVEKGSIAVDGVSLTVAAVDGEGFEVSLIPETLEQTTLGSIEPGRVVNLEVDILAKYVEKLVAAR
ncbi:MAG: riboflavin synthase [Thermoleophilaceae bacterium]|jgi:riboflavin synthase|nr:riboflavin synthase [Thermoleophilaceae bacterium]